MLFAYGLGHLGSIFLLEINLLKSFHVVSIQREESIVERVCVQVEAPLILIVFSHHFSCAPEE